MAFLRVLLQVLLGFFLGIFVAVKFLPEINDITISFGGGSSTKENVSKDTIPPSDERRAKAVDQEVNPDNTVFGRRGGSTGAAVRIDGGQASAEVTAREETGPGTIASASGETARPADPRPVAPVASPEPPPAAPVAVAPIDTTPVDFGELCIKPAAWPPIITLTKDTNAEVRQGEEVIAEIPLAVGDKLQVSKVFGDGTVEVRAKGAKFVVHHTVTDLEPQARVRLNEISGKPRAPAPQPVVQRPSPTPAGPARPVPGKDEEEPPAQRNNDDLDRKMRSLFGERERR